MSITRIKGFQVAVKNWLLTCFGEKIANDKLERVDRYLEESFELAQSLDYSKERLIELIEYVYNRPKGEPKQELGGVMVTLAALCHAHNLDLEKSACEEYSRANIPEIMERIRIKQASKPTGTALPQ